MAYQLKIGTRVEREHKPTIRKMQAYHAETGKCLPDNKVYESIAKDHLKEDKNYYKKLKKAGL